MNEVDKLYENANIKPEYRYDCNLADTIKPVEVFPLRSCSKGEIKDFCINKQDYRYCKVYKVNKIYPPFTAEKQIELIKWLGELDYLGLMRTTMETKDWIFNSEYNMSGDIYKHSSRAKTFEETLAKLINSLWQDLTEEEKQQIKEILE